MKVNKKHNYYNNIKNFIILYYIFKKSFIKFITKIYIIA